jgi:hypothetical protein
VSLLRLLLIGIFFYQCSFILTLQNFGSSHERHTKRHGSVAASQKLDELEKEMDNLQWFFHQIYEEQQAMKENEKKERRALHRLVKIS